MIRNTEMSVENLFIYLYSLNQVFPPVNIVSIF